MSGRQSLSLGGNPTSPLPFCQRCGISQCARRWCAPHRFRGGTSPVLRKGWSVRWSADIVSTRWRIVLDQPSPAARPGPVFVAVVAHARYGHPLRFYIRPHCPQCPPVGRTLPVCRPPLRALSGDCNRPYAKWPSLESVAQSPALPGRLVAPYAPPSACPCSCRGTVALVRRFAQRSGQWPTARHVVCAPPTLWPRRCAALALRWSARPPPRGSLSPAQKCSFVSQPAW